MNRRLANSIDVHQHLIPPVYRRALAEAGMIDPIPGVDYPDWGVEQALAVMDRRGIAAAVLSVTEPGVHFAGDRIARRLSRDVNEYLAGLIRDHPERFGGFAVLPLPDVDAAMEELRYALDVLGLDGVGLLSNYRGLYPGNQELEPLLAEVEDREVPAFIHPASPPDRGANGFGLPVSLYEFTFETTRAVANLLYSRTLDKHPSLRIIVPHAGGAIPYLAHRLTYGPTISARLAERAPRDLIGSLRRLFYDTAMSANEYALPSLRSLVDPDHILFGTDFPFMPEETTVETIEGISGFDGFTDSDLVRIASDNALQLFPRLQSRRAATGLSSEP
jgi:predicted TIM-barrel fold metal-dependent hydrolase